MKNNYYKLYNYCVNNFKLISILFSGCIENITLIIWTLTGVGYNYNIYAIIKY